MKLSRVLLSSFLVLSLTLTACGTFFEELRYEISKELGLLSSDEMDYYDDYYYDDYYYDDYYDYYDNEYYASYSAVESLNEYTSLLNDVYYAIDSLEYDVYYYNEDIEYYDPEYYEPYFYCYFEIYNYDWLNDATSNPSTELSEDEREWLIAKSDEVFLAIDNIKETCLELDRYVSAQDYKDDEFANSTILVESIYAEIDKYYELHDDLNIKLDELYDIYENFEVDPNNPLSVGAGNMRTDLDLAEELLDLVRKAYDESSLAEKDTLESLYDQLTLNIEANSENPGITDEYVIDWYDYFYSDLQDDFMPAAKRCLRAFRNDSIDDLYNAYWDLNSYYGYMVDDYNTYLDAAGY